MAAIAQGEAPDAPVPRRSKVGETAVVCVVAVVLLGALALSGFALWTEIVVSKAETLAADAIASGDSASSELEPLAHVEALCLIPCQPRVLDAAATVRLAAAAALPSDRRGPLLLRARRDLARAGAAEPLNGPVAIREAYAASLAQGTSQSDVLGLVERSYRVQPYSRTSGFWRVSGVVRHWNRAPPELKSEALREALWLPATGAYDRNNITDLFESAGLGLQLQLARSLPPN